MTDVTQGLSGVGDMATQLHTSTPGGGFLFGGMSPTGIALSLLAGLIGSAYFIYGKKSCNFKMLGFGVALCVVPYFIANTIILVVACIAMVAGPFVL